MVSGLAHSGRVIFAAAAVMVAVFFTFALSGPLPPKEMGIILGVAVLLDAALVRLLLLPVLLRLMGARAWYLPKWLHRILPDVRFGPESRPVRDSFSPRLPARSVERLRVVQMDLVRGFAHAVGGRLAGADDRGAGVLVDAVGLA